MIFNCRLTMLVSTSYAFLRPGLFRLTFSRVWVKIGFLSAVISTISTIVLLAPRDGLYWCWKHVDISTVQCSSIFCSACAPHSSSLGPSDLFWDGESCDTARSWRKQTEAVCRLWLPTLALRSFKLAPSSLLATCFIEWTRLLRDTLHKRSQDAAFSC